MSDQEEIETGDQSADSTDSADVESDTLDDKSYEGEEWLGEEDFEEEDAAVLEEEVPSYVDNNDGTVSDTRNSLMWKKSDSYDEFGYGITWFEAHDYCEANE